MVLNNCDLLLNGLLLTYYYLFIDTNAVAAVKQSLLDIQGVCRHLNATLDEALVEFNKDN
jgi:hypothetical protein